MILDVRENKELCKKVDEACVARLFAANNDGTKESAADKAKKAKNKNDEDTDEDDEDLEMIEED